MRKVITSEELFLIWQTDYDDGILGLSNLLYILNL